MVAEPKRTASRPARDRLLSGTRGFFATQPSALSSRRRFIAEPKTSILDELLQPHSNRGLWSGQFMTDSRTGFGGLGCGPSQLTEGEPGCIFLPQRVTNPAESPLE